MCRTTAREPILPSDIATDITEEWVRLVVECPSCWSDLDAEGRYRDDALSALARRMTAQGWSRHDAHGWACGNCAKATGEEAARA